MGYRNYFYQITESAFQELNSLESFKELKEWAKSNPEFHGDIDELDDEINEDDKGYVPLYKIGEEKFGFGKYYENSKKINKTGVKLFKNEELFKRYKEYEPYVVQQEGVREAIDYQISLIEKSYKNILDFDESNKYGDYSFENPNFGKTKTEAFENFIRNSASEWQNIKGYGLLSVNLKLDDDQVTDSWKYEYNIFELIRLYKHTDWENNRFLFMGW